LGFSGALEQDPASAGNTQQRKIKILRLMELKLRG